MIFLTVLAILYRHLFERLIDHESYEARMQLREIRHLQEQNDEKLMQKMNEKDKSSDQQDEMSDNSKDKTMEVDEYPKIKGFKHKYLELQQTSIINL